jgi:hypothetical protein
MNESRDGRRLLLLWVAVLLGPIAWFVSLNSMFWLTHPVCQGYTRSWIFIAGGVCAALAIAAGLGAWRALARRGFPPERSGVEPFMLRLAIGASAVFTLVILLSLVPGTLLTPCPV